MAQVCTPSAARGAGQMAAAESVLSPDPFSTTSTMIQPLILTGGLGDLE